jgi:hypothetical protein
MLPEKPKVSETVGGRVVIASGVLVLTRFDTAAAFSVDDLTFNFAFVPDPGDLAVDTQYVSDQAVRIRFTGTIGPLPVSYVLPQVGTWSGFYLTLGCMVHSVTDQGNVDRLISYTLSGTHHSLVVPTQVPTL